MDIREPKHAHGSDVDLSVDSKAAYKTPVLVMIGQADEMTQLGGTPAAEGATASNSAS